MQAPDVLMMSGCAELPFVVTTEKLLPTLEVCGAPTNVIVCDPFSITRVNCCVAESGAELLAVTVTTLFPTVPNAGVPEMAPLPSPLSTKRRPAGRPRADSIGVGVPDASTVKEPCAPIANMAWLGLANASDDDVAMLAAAA